MTSGRAKLAAGLVLTGLTLGVALLSLAWTPAPPERMRIALRLHPPAAEALFGTDAFGHDVLSMLMVGAWNSLTIALPAVLLGTLGGVLLGVIAAGRGGVSDRLIMRLADVIFAFPPILSAMMLGALLGPGRLTAIIAIAVFMVPVFARIARTAAAQIWVRDFILAARGAGKGGVRITLDHILPNIAGAIIVQITLQLGLALLTEAGLSFMGLGLAPPAPTWGRMLADAQTYLAKAPWLALAPGLAIAFAVLGFNLLGDGLAARFNPKGQG